MGDQAAAELEAGHAFEHDRLALGAGEARGVAEAPAGVGRLAVAQGLGPVPAVVAAGVVEALEHRRDRGSAGVGAEEAVVVGAVFGEERGEAGSVIGDDGGGEAVE